MKTFGIVPMAGNPATAQLIIPGVKGDDLKPFGSEPKQLYLPFKDEKKNIYCNGCEFFQRIPRPGQQTYNCKCLADDSIPGGKIIKLKAYPEEKVKKQFWCPIIKKEIMGDKTPLIVPNKKSSAMSDDQLNSWNKSREERLAKEKWVSLPGITSWNEIEVGKNYHMPPMFKRGRMDFRVVSKYAESIMAYERGTKKRVWLYKQDEEYKFISEIK